MGGEALAFTSAPETTGRDHHDKGKSKQRKMSLLRSAHRFVLLATEEDVEGTSTSTAAACACECACAGVCASLSHPHPSLARERRRVRRRRRKGEGLCVPVGPRVFHRDVNTPTKTKQTDAPPRKREADAHATGTQSPAQPTKRRQCEQAHAAQSCSRRGQAVIMGQSSRWWEEHKMRERRREQPRTREGRGNLMGEGGGRWADSK